METMKRINKQLIAFLMSLIFLLEPAVTTFAATEKNGMQGAMQDENNHTVSGASVSANPQEDIPIETTDVPVNVIRVDATTPTADGNFIDPYAGERIHFEGKTTDESHEIVLVLDVSGSMDGNRIAELKEACLNFVSDILSEDPNAGIAIVTFASSVTVYDFSGRYFTNDLIALKNTISGIRSGGGTAMNAGLVKADELLYKYGSADKQFIIQMADGEPNEGISYNGPDKRFSNGYESQIYNTYTAITGTAEYYIMSLGFFHSMSESGKTQAREFMKSVQNSGYIEVGSGDELRFSFENISSFISTRPMLLYKSSLLLCPTLSEQLNVRFTSAYTATDRTVTWTSSDPAIAKAGADGLITGVSVGACTVTASAGGNTVSCQVTVGNEPEKFFPKKSVTVYQNQNDPGAEEDFVLAEDAVITYCNKEYHTSKTGVASVPLAATGDITIEKAGYRKRIVSAGDLKNGNYTVYLEKESDNPIIYSVWCDDVDLLDSEIQIGLTDKTKRKFSADVDWGKNQYGAIVLAQETKTVPFTQNVLETVLCDTFDVSDDIYIIAKDNAGHSIKKKLQISMENDFLNGTKFDFGSKTKVTIPKDVPFIGGSDLTFDLKTLEKLPLSVEVEKRKVKVVIGVDLGSYEKKTTTKKYRKRGQKYSPKAETSNLCKDVKEIYKTFIQHPGETAQNCGKEVKGAFKKLKNIKNIYKNQMAKPKTKFGLEAECSVMGYIEAYIGDDGLHFLEGGIMIVPEISAKWSGQFFVPIPVVNFIPFFWEAGLKAELEVLVNLARAAGSAENFTCMLSVDFKITGNGGVGVGVSGVIGLSGGVKLKINTKFKTYMKGSPYMSLNIDVNGYVKFEFLFLSYEWETDPWHLVDVNNGVADHPESINTQTQQMDPEAGMLDIENYKPMDLSYLEKEEELCAETRGGLAIEQIFKANSFTGATPKLVTFEDGTSLAVWKDNFGTDYNDIQLYYSYFDGSTWSDATLLDEDYTLDGTFDLAASGNTAYVVWQNMESQIPAGIKIDKKEDYAKILKDTGIKAAVFDTRTESFTVSTITAPDDKQDMMPVVCAGGDSADLVWVKNADNAAFGENGQNAIYTTHLNADGWGQTTEVEADCEMILELAAGRVNDQLYYATLREQDGDLETNQDRAVLINRKKIVSDQEALGRISFENGHFYWYQNESIVRSKELSDPAKTSYESVLPKQIRLLNDNYQVFDEDGQLRLLVLVEEGNKNELYQFIKDEEHDSWSSALPVSTLGGSINSFCGALNKDDLSVIVSYATLTDPDAEEITKSLYGQNNVVLISYEPHNKLNVTDCIYDPELIVPGAVLPMTAVVQNESDQSVEAVTLKLYDKTSGMVVSERQIDQEILAGDVGELDFNYLIKEEDLGRTFELQAVSDSKAFEQGAAAEVEINYQNLALDQTGWGKYADEKNAAIQGMVVNDGYTDAGSVKVELYKVDKATTDPSEEGLGAEMALVDSKDLGDIPAMDAKPLCFDVPYVEEAVYMLAISSDMEDLNLGDDTEYIYLTQRDQKLNRSLQSLTIKAPRTYYAVGEKIDLSALRVEANYSDGLTADVTGAAVINTSAVKPDQIGAYTVTASYGGKSTSLTIEVLSQSEYQKRKEQEQAKDSNDQKDDGQRGEADSGKEGKTPQKGEVIKDKTGSYQVNDISALSGGASNTEGISGTVTYMGGAGGKTKVKTVTIPDYIYLNQKKYKVNEIADNAFARNKQITRVVIPRSIERIGKKAFFGCKNLKTIVIKTTKLKKGSIGKQAFKKAGSKNYKKLTVTVPKSKKKQYPALLKKAGLYRKAKMKYKK